MHQCHIFYDSFLHIRIGSDLLTRIWTDLQGFRGDHLVCSALSVRMRVGVSPSDGRREGHSGLRDKGVPECQSVS